MRIVTISKEIIKAYPHKTSKNRPRRPHCKICACFNRLRWYNPRDVLHSGWQTKYHVHVFEVGEEAVEIWFRNGTVGYYSLKCWNDPLNKEKVARILKQEYPKKKLSAS